MAAVSLVAAVAVIFGPLPATAQTDGKDNTAVAVNTKDASTLFKFAFNGAFTSW